MIWRSRTTPVRIPYWPKVVKRNRKFSCWNRGEEPFTCREKRDLLPKNYWSVLPYQKRFNITNTAGKTILHSLIFALLKVVKRRVSCLWIAPFAKWKRSKPRSVGPVHERYLPATIVL